MPGFLQPCADSARQCPNHYWRVAGAHAGVRSRRVTHNNLGQSPKGKASKQIATLYRIEGNVRGAISTTAGDADSKNLRQRSRLQKSGWITPERRCSQILDRKRRLQRATAHKGGAKWLTTASVSKAAYQPLGYNPVLSDFRKRLPREGKPHKWSFFIDCYES